MKLDTSWVLAPQSVDGLDHLGTQAPCVLIYSQLLPGITNVTERARYYSFYPWLIWSFDNRYKKNNITKFIEFFRRADCLFTLISERHSRNTDGDNERHGVAMVGRVKLLPALDRLEAGELLSLSQYTAQNSPNRYFKNPMGGLSQYYAGTLSDLDLISSQAKPWFQYTKEHGAPLAEKVEAAIPSDQFWAAIEANSVTLKDLDTLKAFCPCRLTDSIEECKTLTDIYFDLQNVYSEEGTQRRRSLALIQHLVEALPEGHDLSEELFRACSYSSTLPGRHSWAIPQILRSTLEHWSIYVRNDLLSVTCQTVLSICLRELQPRSSADRLSFISVESFARAFSRKSAVKTVSNKRKSKTFGEMVDKLRDEAPPMDAWENENHEIQLAQRMIDCWNSRENNEALLQLILTVIAMLTIRDDPNNLPYAGLAVPAEALSDYPINLASFRQRVIRWHPMTLPEMIADLVGWCLNTHLRVALRKLRQTGRSTFHFRPSERGLEVVGDDIPSPSNTRPRFQQATQILRDIGVLIRDQSSTNRKTTLSEIGFSLMEKVCG